ESLLLISRFSALSCFPSSTSRRNPSQPPTFPKGGANWALCAVRPGRAGGAAPYPGKAPPSRKRRKEDGDVRGREEVVVRHCPDRLSSPPSPPPLCRLRLGGAPPRLAAAPASGLVWKVALTGLGATLYFGTLSSRTSAAPASRRSCPGGSGV